MRCLRLEISLGKALYIIQSKDRSFEERMNAIDLLSEYTLTEIESNFAAILRTLDPLLARTLAGDPDEKRLFIKLLRELGLISEKSEKISGRFLSAIVGILRKHHARELDIEVTVTLIDIMRYPLRKNPWLFFDIVSLLKDVARSKSVDTIYTTLFKLISDVAWEIPYIVNDFTDLLETMLKSQNEDLRAEVIRTLIKAGKRSFLAVKKMALDTLTDENAVRDPLLLEFLTSLHIPKEYKDVAEQVYIMIHENYIARRKDSEDISIGVLSLARLISREELGELQERFLDDLMSLITEEKDENVLRSCVQASMIPIWNKNISLDRLYNELFELMQYGEISAETKLLILDAISKIILQRTQYVQDSVKRLLEALDFIRDPELRKRIIDLMKSMFYMIKDTDVIGEVASTMLKVISNVLEKDFVRNSAGDLLEAISKHVPMQLLTYSQDILNIFNEIPDWITRDFIIKIAGEILKKTETPDDYLVKTLIAGLFDNLTYISALDYLNIIAYRFPDYTIKYLSEIEKFSETLRELEETILREEGLESYYHFIEEPKRLYIRILTTLALNSQDLESIERIARLLVDILKDETNEIIKKDISNSLKEIALISDTLLNYIKNIAKKKNCIEILRNYGFDL